MPDGQRRPAIVIKTNDDDTCNLHVFTDGANEGGVAHHQPSVPQGEEPRCWSWPPLPVSVAGELAAGEMKAAA
jgi:hypothetical protein